MPSYIYTHILAPHIPPRAGGLVESPVPPLAPRHTAIPIRKLSQYVPRVTHGDALVYVFQANKVKPIDANLPSTPPILVTATHLYGLSSPQHAHPIPYLVYPY